MAVAGRRFGKSFLAATELIKAATSYDGAAAWYLAPVYRQTDEVWRTLKTLCRKNPLCSKINEAPKLRIEFRGLGAIECRSADNAENLRSAGLDLLIADEYADMDGRIWATVLRPMLSDRLGRALFIGTPKGWNHFKDMYTEAKSKPDWEAFQFTSLEGGNIPPEEIEAARNELGEREFRQEYEASFENMYSGQVYYAFDRTENVKPLEHNPHYPLFWSPDFNVDPMCSVYGQVIESKGWAHVDVLTNEPKRVTNVLGEICLRNANVFDACREFVDRTQRYIRPGQVLHVVLYGDPAGSARSHAGPSSYQNIFDFFKTQPRYRIEQRTATSAPEVKDRVNVMNSQFCNAAGIRNLFLDPSCKELMKDLEKVVWKADLAGNITAQIDKADPLRTHVSDALGYAIFGEFGGHKGGVMSGRLI